MTFSQTEKEEALLEFARSDPFAGGSVARSLELARAVLVQEPDAIFTVLTFTTAKMLTSISVMSDLFEELTNAATDLAIKPQELNDITSLQSSARLARSVDSSVSSRGVVGSGQGARLSTSLRRAARDLTEGLRSSNRLRYSYDEARSLAPRHIRTIRTQLETILATLANLTGAVTALNNSNIRSRLAEDRVERIRLGVEDLSSQMEDLVPADRSVIARAAALRLLAANVELQDVLRDLTSGQPRLIQPPAATAAYKLNADGEGTAPSLIGTISAPWRISVGFEDLTVDVNGVSTGAIDILDGNPGILAASLVGTVDGGSGFPISGDISTPPAIESSEGSFNIVSGTSDQLYIKVDSTTFRITLTAGATRSATQIASDINTDTTVVAAGNPVTAADVANRVRLTYTNASPPTSFSGRRLEVITAQGGYNPEDDATDLANWRLATSPNTEGTRSIGRQANNVLKLQINDDPDVIDVTIPSGSWPDYTVLLGDTGTPGTIVYAIDQAATTNSENFSADDFSSYLRIFSIDKGDGSIITIRSDGGDTASGRCIATLGFFKDQEDRKSDIESSTVVTALNKNSTLLGGASVKMDRKEYLASSGSVSAAQAIEIPVVNDPTGDWPDASLLKIRVAAPNANGSYQVSSYSWASGVLTINVSRRLRDAVSTTCQVRVYKALLQIDSTDASVTGQLQASGTPTTVLGIPTDLVRASVRKLLVSENNPAVGWVTKNLVGDNIRAFDVIRNPDGSDIDVITDIDEENGLLDIETGVDANFTVSTAGFTIYSAAALAYATLVDEVDDWIAEDPTSLLNEMTEAFARLYVAKSRDAAANARSKVSAFETAIGGLETVLEAYSPPVLSVMINAMNGLSENGQDRARSLLVDADISNFVAISGDGSTIEALRKAAASVSYRDLGAETDNRQSIPRAVWVDATDPGRTYPDFEPEEDVAFPPQNWGDSDI